ncbi:MAG: SxtJ family membrane protein, partial [Planctomycetaceae bacterium]|jgi:hypothetical protein|nr:SxtJ family membrane protein [Planctomycetaceae bacterium]
VTVGLIVLIVNMICPTAFKPAAVLWFGLAEVLGTVVSRIVLTLVFVLMVIPVGLLRYYAGSDPMRLKEWKQKKFPQTSQNSESVKVGGGGARYEDSVFIERNHQYSAQDIINPY